jgi:hypothetical protein
MWSAPRYLVRVPRIKPRVALNSDALNPTKPARLRCRTPLSVSSEKRLLWVGFLLSPVWRATV